VLASIQEHVDAAAPLNVSSARQGNALLYAPRLVTALNDRSTELPSLLNCALVTTGTGGGCAALRTNSVE
jgi:hypothetical protein